MATVSGVEVELISKIGEVTASSIKYISGIDTREIPGWPSGPTSCVDLSYQYGPTPEIACSESSGLYSFNTMTQQLFQFGYCDNVSYYAPEGFYVDTFGDIFNWEETTMGWTWSFLGNCTPTPPNCDDKSLSYGEAPGEACSASASFYSFDTENSLLYTFGSCGGDYAPEGFYVDGTMIYRWYMFKGGWVWQDIGTCG